VKNLAGRDLLSLSGAAVIITSPPPTRWCGSHGYVNSRGETGPDSEVLSFGGTRQRGRARLSRQAAEINRAILPIRRAHCCLNGAGRI